MTSSENFKKEEISADNSPEKAEEKKNKAHKALFERYEESLKGLDLELITPEDEVNLNEAFTYAKEFFEPEELINWFASISEPFYRAGAWKFLLPYYQELLALAEAKLGPQSSGTATALTRACRNFPIHGKL